MKTSGGRSGQHFLKQQNHAASSSDEDVRKYARQDVPVLKQIYTALPSAHALMSVITFHNFRKKTTKYIDAIEL